MDVGSLLKILLLNIYKDTGDPSGEAAVVIAHRYSERTVHIFTMAPNLLSSIPISDLNVPVILNATKSKLQWRSDAYIVLGRDIQHSIAFLREASYTLRRETPWILVFDSAIQITDLRRVFKAFFYHGILNVIAISSKRSCAYVHTYFPFRDRTHAEGCYNDQPVMIDVWSSHKFLHRAELFPRNKVDNLQNCVVNSLIMPTLPYFSYSKKDSGYPLKGSGSSLFQALTWRMNFTPAFSGESDASRAINVLKKSSLTIGFGISHNPEISHGTPFGSKCFSWCMPTSVTQIRGWEALTHTFYGSLWLACLVSAIVVVLVTSLLVRLSHPESRINRYPPWLIVWNVVFEVPLPTPKETKFRVFFMSFCIACLVIGTAFKARLHVLLSSVPSSNKMSTLSEVYQSGLDLVVHEELRWMVEGHYNETFLKERVRIVNVDRSEVTKFFVRKLTQGTSAILYVESGCAGLAKMLGKTDVGYYKAYFVPECVLTANGASFGFSHASPLSERMEKVTSAMWESGMARKYLSLSFPHDEVSTSKVVIGLKDIRVVFFILFGGLGLSVVILIAELIFYTMKYTYFT